MRKPLTIGLLAKKAGVNVETVRYYQRIGILEEPARPLQGYRVYPDSAIDRIRFIKRAQQLGFRLDEIQELLDIGGGHCDDVRQRAELKQKQIEQQIEDLQLLHKTLDDLIVSCKLTGEASDCPIVETLARKIEK